MSTAEHEYSPGFQWTGGDPDSDATVVRGVRLDSAVGGANYSGSELDGPQNRGIQARGIALSSPVAGAQFSPTVAGQTNAAFGGQWDGPVTDSVSSLIDTSGFALVLARRQGAERIVFSSDQPPYRDIKNVGWTEEINAMASWSATVPVNQDLYDWPFERAIVAFDGDRRFHGVVLPVKAGARSDGEIELSGYGPLFWAGHGDITVSYSDMAAHRAIDDVWLHVARESDGEVRGSAVRPQSDHINDHWIPSEGVEFSGTPLSVLKEIHGYAGMAFAADHSEQATHFESFVPGEELRSATWNPTDSKPSVSPEGYHNQITVRGATKPGVGEQNASDPGRYSATVTAPRTEIGSVMNGRIHGRAETESDLESDAACRARAHTLLEEDRGQYTIGGSLTVAPDVRNLVAGYTYRIPEFDRAAPASFTPVYATLRSVGHSFGPGEASIALEFEDESALVQHIRTDLLPEMAPRSAKRRGAQANAGNPNYDRPINLEYDYGDGIWGTGRFGGTMTEEPESQSQ